MKAKLLIVSSLVVMATASQAVILITNLQFSSPYSGASLSASGNSVSFSSAASVGDSLPTRFGIITYQYDATSSSGPIGTIRLNFGGFTSGSGVVTVREDVYKLDSNGLEIGGVHQSFVASSSNALNFVQSQAFQLQNAGSAIRVKKTITLDAVTMTQGTDIAALSYVNQAVEVVPEPASMVAIAVGLAGMMRRRKTNA